MKIKLSQFTLRKAKENLIIEITVERTCDERGHFAKDYPKNKVHSHKKKGNKRRHHAHVAEDDEPSKKRTRYESEDSSSEDEYVVISALIGNITHGSDDWLIDNGASKHMTRFKESFIKL